jgi:hypothetical protein
VGAWRMAKRREQKSLKIDVLDGARRIAASGSGAAVGGVHRGIASPGLWQCGGEAFFFSVPLTSSNMAVEDSGTGGGASGQEGGGSRWGRGAHSRDGDGERGGEHSKTTERGRRIRMARCGPPRKALEPPRWKVREAPQDTHWSLSSRIERTRVLQCFNI